MTDVIVRQPRICLTSAARLPQGKRALYRKNAAKRTAAVRDTYDVSFCIATVLLLLHECLAAAFHLT